VNERTSNIGDEISELDGKPGQCCLPISDGHRLLQADVEQCQEKQIEQRFVAGKRTPVLGQLAQAHVHGFDGVGRVDHLANLRRVVEERDQSAAVEPPALANGQVFFVPAGLEFTQALLGLLCRSRLVDVAQIGHHILETFP